MSDTQVQTDEQPSSPTPSDSVQPSMTMHPISYSGVPMTMYPFPPGMVASQPSRTKRRQVKNACTNCQKACKKCDDARPCLRCVKYGIAEECIDSQRKERQKGIKRGPYKKRDGKSRSSASLEQPVDVTVQQAGMIPAAVAATSGTPLQIPYMAAPPGYFYPSPYPMAAGKPGEPTPMFYPQIYFAPMPPPHGAGQDGEVGPYPGLYPVMAPYAMPPGYAAAPYMVPHARPDAQMGMPPPGAHYSPYPQPYPKPPSRDMGHEVTQMMDPNGRREMRASEGMSAGQGR